MSNNINFEDIQPGDTIKATGLSEGVRVERTGKVKSISNLGGTVCTEEGGVIWSLYWAGKPNYQLIDRPKPPLPIVTGSVIIANRVTGLGTPHMAVALRYDGDWVSLATGKVIEPSYITEWTPAKVVEA